MTPFLRFSPEGRKVLPISREKSQKIAKNNPFLAFFAHPSLLLLPLLIKIFEKVENVIIVPLELGTGKYYYYNNYLKAKI